MLFLSFCHPIPVSLQKRSKQKECFVKEETIMQNLFKILCRENVEKYIAKSAVTNMCKQKEKVKYKGKIK